MSMFGGVGSSVGAGAGGFSWGEFLQNPLFLDFLATLGGSLDPEGPAGKIAAFSKGMTKNKSQLGMMQKLLAGGAKIDLNKDGYSIKGETSKLAGVFGSGGQDKQGKSLALANEGSQLPKGSGTNWGIDGKLPSWFK